MSDEKKEKSEDKTIQGQMSYDEVLKPEEQNKQTDSQNITINGQSTIFDALKKLDAQIKENKDHVSKQSENIMLDAKKDIQNKQENLTTDDNQTPILENLPEEKVEKLEANCEKPEKKERAKKSDSSNGNGTENVIYRSLDEVIHDSMIPYTEHVVMERALPRVEDGLKPVQRRILYSMLELGLAPDKPFRKSARIVGDCMGKYHPHGDSSVYDAMVRMSQSFSLREPLVSGHGNFGSMDGDGAAAMRYTEAKLTPLAMEMLRDLEKDTVKWSFNFDDTLKEPDILPGRFPNLLVNGASGIAVGVATNIPPHNLAEVIDGVVAYINNEKISLDEMMKIIRGPDFPTGGIIIAGNELKEAYATGRGKIILKAKVEVEKDGDKKQLVITEFPYQVNKASLLQKIAEMKQEDKDKMSFITEIRDESDRDGVRAVIKLKKDANEMAVLEYLMKYTQLQISFAINMVAIAGGRPKQLGLLEIIAYYAEYQRQIIYARTKYDLDLAKERAHIVEGLLIAIANINEVIRIIKKSESITAAKEALKERFALSEKQAQAILEMKLSRLVNLEIEKLQEELKDLQEKIKEYQAIVDSKKLQLSIVKTELLQIKKEYRNPRRSEIKEVDDIYEATEFTEDHDEAFAREIIVGINGLGAIKQMPIKNYSLSQKEITSSSTLSDVHTKLYKTMTNKTLLLFTNKGNTAKILASDIPEAKWRDNGSMLIDLIKSAALDEKVVSVFEIPEENTEKKLYFYTKLGYVKSVNFVDCIVAKNFYSVMNLKENDEVIEIESDTDATSVVMVSKSGNAISFAKDEIPCQSRNASGVMGMNIEENDCILEAKQIVNKGSLTIITKNGFGKKIPIGELTQTSRNKKGQRIVKFDDDNGELVYARYGETASDVVLMKQTKLVMIGQRNISYDSRLSKGKQVAKGKFEQAFTYAI